MLASNSLAYDLTLVLALGAFAWGWYYTASHLVGFARRHPDLLTLTFSGLFFVYSALLIYQFGVWLLLLSVGQTSFLTAYLTAALVVAGFGHIIRQSFSG
jgi:hypothetical protein